VDLDTGTEFWPYGLHVMPHAWRERLRWGQSLDHLRRTVLQVNLAQLERLAGIAPRSSRAAGGWCRGEMFPDLPALERIIAAVRRARAEHRNLASRARNANNEG
jgi:hypothetical protein